MSDPVGVVFASIFIFLAFGVLFFAKQLKGRSVTAIVILSLAVVVLVRGRVSEMVVSYGQIQFKLTQVENRLADITEVMETLLIAQRIEKLEPDGSILLDYNPVPQSVRITVGPLVNFPRANYGYSMEGRKIRIINKEVECDYPDS